MKAELQKWNAELKVGRWKKFTLVILSAVPVFIGELPEQLFEHWYLSLIVDWLKEHLERLEIGKWLVGNLWALPILVVCGILVHAYLRSLRKPKDPPALAISAKYVRKRIIPRNPFEGMTAKIVRDAGGRSPAAPFDILLEVHVVNTTAQPLTIQKIEAQAELEGTWHRLKEADLKVYQLAHDDPKFAQGGMRNATAKMEPLVSLWDQIRGKPLAHGHGFQGWLAFEIFAENDQLEGKQTWFKVWLVDSLEGKHSIVTIDELNAEGRITYVT